MWMIVTNWQDRGRKVLNQEAGGKKLGEVQVTAQQRRDHTGRYEDDGDSGDYKQQQYRRDYPTSLSLFSSLSWV